MSSIVYLRNKSNGKVYAYLNESVWNSELKRCQCKRKCLGHVDPDTGDIIPNRGGKEKEYATVRSRGAILFLRIVSEKIGLTESIKQAFPDHWKLIQSCVFYILMERSELSKINYWSIDNDTPYRKPITPEAISELLPEVNDNALFSFFREWRDTADHRDFYMLHISSLSTYDSRSGTIRFNDLPSLYIRPMTNISMIYSARTGLPVTYEVYNGLPRNITDLHRRTVEKQWLDISDVTQVLDMDFTSEENINDLLRSNIRFLIRVAPEFKFARNSVDRVKDRIMDLSNYTTVDGVPFFMMSFI